MCIRDSQQALFERMQEMNIAFFLLPKNKVSFLCEDFTLRKAIGKMKHSGFTDMPVITKEGKYVGTINGGRCV